MVIAGAEEAAGAKPPAPLPPPQATSSMEAAKPSANGVILYMAQLSSRSTADYTRCALRNEPRGVTFCLNPLTCPRSAPATTPRPRWRPSQRAECGVLIRLEHIPRPERPRVRRVRSRPPVRSLFRPRRPEQPGGRDHAPRGEHARPSPVRIPVLAPCPKPALRGD